MVGVAGSILYNYYTALLDMTQTPWFSLFQTCNSNVINGFYYSLIKFVASLFCNGIVLIRIFRLTGHDRSVLPTTKHEAWISSTNLPIAPVKSEGKPKNSKCKCHIFKLLYSLYLKIEKKFCSK